MRLGLVTIKNKRPLASVIVVWLIVTTSMIVVFPLSAPKARGQVIHNLPGGAMEEDMTGAPYDMGPIGDGEVIWDATQDHVITVDYDVQPGFTLNIPALNFTPPSGWPGQLRITFEFPASRIEVFGNPGNPGRLITNFDGDGSDYTAFLSTPPMFWDGIYFHANSEGCIANVYIRNCTNGIVFEPGSKLISPGVYYSRIRTYGFQGMLLDGVSGYTSIRHTRFEDPDEKGTSLVVRNCMVSLSGIMPSTRFSTHGPGKPSLYISDAQVSADMVIFDGNYATGSCVYIEGKSNASVFTDCQLIDGAAGHHYIEVNGSSPLFTDCSFEFLNNELTIIANDDTFGVPAHPILRNPYNYQPDPFINTTLNATGASSVTLQWYLDVYVIDPDSNPIGGSTVTVDGAIPGAPDMPSIKTTPLSGPDIGWVRGFIITEFILYSTSVTNYNPYNVSADNESAIGYAIPEATMDVSKSITVIVPFSAIPNPPPIVSWLEDLQDTIQGSEVSIGYILYDPNKGDNGSLYIIVEFSLDGTNWITATPASGSPSTTNLYNNTLYYFIWDSYFDLGVIHNTTVYLRITPWDRWAQGTPSQTGNFTLDTEPPKFLTPPQVMELTDTIAIINWTMEEPCDAVVWYGLDDTLIFETTGSTGTTEQSVTLTGLQPGRKYSFFALSTDALGNTASSIIYVFYTKVYIQLYKGWNMISIPPDIPVVSLSSVLAPIAGEYDAVQTYDASDISDPWKHYQINKPQELNDLTTVDFTKGLWIHMLNDAILIPNQIVPPTVNPPMSIRLEDGWNFVGYPSAITRSVNAALGFNFNIVQTYNAATGQWLSWDGFSGDLMNMEIGRGYWIHVTAGAIWNIDYA